MKRYLVGGAVRDILMGKVPSDYDYVLVGATPQDIQNLTNTGYKWVGKDFPVLIEPATNNEVALARIERKMGSGHCGFDIIATPDVTLEQDLSRRDLTINAIAQDVETKEIIDPYNGQQDLQHRVLRHVSESFYEDPLRVFRVARFRAKLGFIIHKDTLCLIEKIKQTGEILNLPSERIWIEICKSLETSYPWLFFETLFELDLMSVIANFTIEDNNISIFNTLLKSTLDIANEYNCNIVQKWAIFVMILNLVNQSTSNVSFNVPVPTKFAKVSNILITMVNIMSRSEIDELDMYNLFIRMDIRHHSESIDELLVVYKITGQTLYHQNFQTQWRIIKTLISEYMNFFLSQQYNDIQLKYTGVEMGNQVKKSILEIFKQQILIFDVNH